MNIKTIWDSQTLFGYFAWPTVARLPDGRIIAVCSGFRMRHVCPFGRVVAFYSEDEGASWSSPVLLSDSLLDSRDAGICVSKDLVLLTTFTSGKAVQEKYMDMWYRYDGLKKENDFISAYLNLIDGKAEKEQLGSFVMLGNGYRFGERIRVFGNLSAPHGAFAKNGGGFWYAGEYRSFGADEAQGKLALLGSDDGIRWTEKGEIDLPENDLRFCECHGIQLPDGKIIVLVRVQGQGKFEIWQSESYDEGAGFTPLRPVIGDGAPPHIIRHSSGALICSYANRTLPHAGPRAAISFNGGESWEHRIVLRSDAAGEDIGYSSSVELRDGRVLTVFYFTDRKPQDKTALESVVWSLDEAEHE